MNSFITIQDAIEITGKSESTIRRVIAGLKNEKDKDKYLITEQGITKDRYLIQKEYLFKKLRFDPNKQIKKSSKGTPHDESELIKQLREEINYLKKQVEIHQREKAQLMEKLPDKQLLQRLLEAETRLKKLS